MLLRPSEAAELCGVSNETLLEWERQGWLLPVKTPGGHRRYYKDTIERLLKKQVEGCLDEIRLTIQYDNLEVLPRHLKILGSRVTGTDMGQISDGSDMEGFTTPEFATYIKTENLFATSTGHRKDIFLKAKKAISSAGISSVSPFYTPFVLYEEEDLIVLKTSDMSPIPYTEKTNVETKTPDFLWGFEVAAIDDRLVGRYVNYKLVGRA